MKIENGVLIEVKNSDIEDGQFIFPDGITSIGPNAFEYLDELRSVVIPDGITSIGNSAFRNCYKLSSIVIPDGVTSIENGAFKRCYKLSSIVIPEGVTSIEEDAFFECDSLSSIIIPNSVISIGRTAFHRCSSLSSIIIPEGVTSIGKHAFSYTALTSVIIPKGMTSIENGAFAKCNALASVTIPESITCIHKCAFSLCKALTNFYINTRSKERYYQILNLLPKNLREKVEENNKLNIKKALTLVAGSKEKIGFFSSNYLPPELIPQILTKFAKACYLPECMVNQVSQQIGNAAETSPDNNAITFCPTAE